ncbi:MAG: hypothetical protein R3327_01145 [Nitrosopumilaceae archaeon]|nr:hypothetical protein [Nitrosopumilaceae archaeon]
MKNSELKRLVSEYMEIKEKQKKKYADSFKLSKKIKEIEQRYFHETGRKINEAT